MVNFNHKFGLTYLHWDIHKFIISALFKTQIFLQKSEDILLPGVHAELREGEQGRGREVHDHREPVHRVSEEGLGL